MKERNEIFFPFLFWVKIIVEFLFDFEPDGLILPCFAILLF